MAIKRTTTPVIGALEQVEAIEITDATTCGEAQQTMNIIKILRQELSDELEELFHAGELLETKLKAFNERKEYELL